MAFPVFTLTTIGSTNALSDLIYKSRVLPLPSGTCWRSVGKNTAVALCVAAFVVSPQVHVCRSYFSIFF